MFCFCNFFLNEVIFSLVYSKLPQPMDSWKTEKDVSDNRVMCPQVNQRFNFQLSNPIREDEDCLYLNVFIPLSPVIK